VLDWWSDVLRWRKMAPVSSAVAMSFRGVWLSGDIGLFSCVRSSSALHSPEGVRYTFAIAREQQTCFPIVAPRPLLVYSERGQWFCLSYVLIVLENNERLSTRVLNLVFTQDLELEGCTRCMVSLWLHKGWMIGPKLVGIWYEGTPSFGAGLSPSSISLQVVDRFWEVKLDNLKACDQSAHEWCGPIWRDSPVFIGLKINLFQAQCPKFMWRHLIFTMPVIGTDLCCAMVERLSHGTSSRWKVEL
jgi:hypothetical protein